MSNNRLLPMPSYFSNVGTKNRTPNQKSKNRIIGIDENNNQEFFLKENDNSNLQQNDKNRAHKVIFFLFLLSMKW